MARNTNLVALLRAGVEELDAYTLRRIASKLQRWHELECGVGMPGMPQGTMAIERDGDEPDSKPFRRVMYPTRDGFVDRREPIADHENSALKRLARVMTRYPALRVYVQGDPRGCALYVIRPEDAPAGADLSSCYSRGVAVY